jgi:hypothetical protein
LEKNFYRMKKPILRHTTSHSTFEHKLPYSSCCHRTDNQP